MTLRKKMLLIVLVTLATLTAVTYGILSHFILDGYTELEQDYADRNIQRSQNAIAQVLGELSSKAGDWATWDDAYDFVKDHNEEFYKTNMNPQSQDALHINLTVIATADGTVTSALWQKPDGTIVRKAPPEIQECLTHQSPLSKHSGLDSSISGLIALSGKPMLIASRPIITSLGQGPIRGSMIFGKYLDKAEVAHLAEITKMKITLFPLGDKAAPLPPDAQKALNILQGGAEHWTKANSDTTMFGYFLMKNLRGTPMLLARIETPRDIYQKGKETLAYVLIIMLILGVATIIAVIVTGELTILSRLFLLQRNVTDIGEHEDFSERVAVQGKDELAQVAHSINTMLDHLEHSHGALRFEQEQMLSIFESIDEKIYVADPDTYEILYANQALKTSFGDDITGKKCHEVFHRLDEPCGFCTNGYIFGENTGKPYVWDFFNDFTKKWYHCIDRAIKWPDGRWARHEIAIDITQRKLAEEKLEFLSHRDGLTGLYNHAFFEEELARITRPPAGIIMCDLDGLKLTNDTMGHAEGDKLIVLAAETIRHCFRKHDIVARIGGDEFAVLLPETPAVTVAALAQRIADEMRKHNAGNPLLPLSISIGYACTEQSPAQMNTVLKQADSAMYADKSRRSGAARSAIVDAIQSTLRKRNLYLEDDGNRLWHLIEPLWRALGDAAPPAEHLQLLATHHDIGEIGIADDILQKNGPLTFEEYTQVKRHCEIGSRIAQASGTLKDIAPLILHHHEHWDGQGYPHRLAGEDIPLECRMFAIVDAFDAMTSERRYRPTMDVPQALEELAAKAGTQFDPRLVELFIRLRQAPARTESAAT